MVDNDPLIIFHYNRYNRYSINALLGAIERRKSLSAYRILFAKTQSEIIENIRVNLDKSKKILICFSFSSPNLWTIQEIISQLHDTFGRYIEGKIAGKKILLIAGGPHPSGLPIKTLRMGFDMVFIGESEWSFPEFLERLADGMDEKGRIHDDYFLKTPGMGYLADNSNKESTPVLNRRPDLIRLDDYPPFSVKYNKLGHIEITRGCPFSCYYCQTPSLFGIKQRHRSIENITYYISELKKKGFTDFRFITPNGFLYGVQSKTPDLGILENLFSEIKSSIGVDNRFFYGTFPSEVRPENVTVETLSLLTKYAANKNLIIGAQSGSDYILEKCHRQHKVEDIINAIKVCKKFQIKPNVDIIFGLPYEDKDTMELTLKFAERITEMGARVHAHSFMPLPGTAFSKFKPTPIPESIKTGIRKLIGKGLLYGDWEQQEALGLKLYEYINS